MSLRPSSFPLRVPLPAPPESSLLEVPDPESDRARAASPTVARLLATAVTDPSFESAAASALVAELLDFAAACRLDYASALVAESVPASPPSVGGECALGTDVLEDRQEDFECLEAAVPCFASMLLAPEGDPDAPHISTPRSYAEAMTGTYVDEVPPPGVNIVDGMWIFSVKRPPGSPPAFKARYVAGGFSQRHGVDYFQTFSPTPKMTTLRVLLHVAAQRDYELHSLDFSTAFLQGSLHEEIWLRRPHGFTGSFPTGTQWSLRRPVYGLRQAPREWHDTFRTTLAALGFVPSTADSSLFLRTDNSMPPFYVLVYVDDLVFATAHTEALTLVKSELQKRHTCTDLGELRSYFGLQITRDRARRTITLTQSHMVHQVFQRFGFQYSSPQLTPLSTSHSLSAPPSDESVEPSGPYPELVGCLMYLMTCTRPDLAYPLSLLARYVAPGRHRKVHWDAAKRVLRYLSSCEAEIYAGAMAAQELRWLTYLLTDLGEQSRSPPVLYVDNKAMIAFRTAAARRQHLQAPAAGSRNNDSKGRWRQGRQLEVPRQQRATVADDRLTSVAPSLSPPQRHVRHEQSGVNHPRASPPPTPPPPPTAATTAAGYRARDGLRTAGAFDTVNGVFATGRMRDKAMTRDGAANGDADDQRKSRRAGRRGLLPVGRDVTNLARPGQQGRRGELHVGKWWAHDTKTRRRFGGRTCSDIMSESTS
ncbi:unnamed protein product [Closterium sp. NIES-54]